MKKYMGLLVLVALAGGVGVAVKAAPDGKHSDRAAAVSEAQIGTLDNRLSQRIIEQQELMDMVERLLHMNFQDKAQERAQSGNVLSGAAKPTTAPAPVPVAKKGTPAAAPEVPPWWQDYKPQMVYGTSTERYAVVNGKMVTLGQSLGKDVLVDGIEEGAVVLRRAGESHTYHLKK